MIRVKQILIAVVLLGGCSLYGDDKPAMPDAGEVEADAEVAPPWGSHWTVTGTRTGTCEAWPESLNVTVDIFGIDPDSINARIDGGTPITCDATFLADRWSLACDGLSLAIDPETIAGNMSLPHPDCSFAPATYSVTVVVE